MDSSKIYRVWTLELVIVLYLNIVCVLSTCVVFALTFHIPVAEKSLLYEIQSSTHLIYRVVDMPTLYLDHTIGHGVVLQNI